MRVFPFPEQMLKKLNMASNKPEDRMKKSRAASMDEGRASELTCASPGKPSISIKLPMKLVKDPLDLNSDRKNSHSFALDSDGGQGNTTNRPDDEDFGSLVDHLPKCTIPLPNTNMSEKLLPHAGCEDGNQTERLETYETEGFPISREQSVDEHIFQQALIPESTPKKCDLSRMSSLELTNMLTKRHRSNPEALPKSSSKRTLLVVDDDATMRVLLTNLARQFGFRCECAENALEAFLLVSQACDKHHSYDPPYEFIIMDYHMPSICGDEATEEILKTCVKLERPYPIIVGHTAEAEGDEMEDFKKSGITALMTKPATAEAFREMLKLRLHT
mmetsp:Transcript_41851/g.48191  ORF Transcript_41851/g.48191 Transcript_41851/m.48191 type:complete len:332 (-) Transcript_41851:944-1939(-)